MENVALQQLKDVLTQTNTIGIVVGEASALDSMAGALGLYLALKSMGKSVSIASAKEPRVSVSTLVGIDQVKNSLGGEGGDLVVSFPYREGEIEKISYTLEDKKLNIVVKAGEQGLTFDQKDVSFTRAGSAPTLLFVVGTPTLASLGTLFNPEALKNTTIVNIDNKRENQGFGDIVLVSQTASSVSEQVAQLLQALGVQIDADTAQNLLSGIADATENFQNPKTTPVAFEMAGLLLKTGATRRQIDPMDEMLRDPFFNPKPANQMPQRPVQSRPPLPQRPLPRPFPQQAPTAQPMSTPLPSYTGSQNTQPMPPMPNNNQPQEQSTTPPSDWLTPKIYKGSTQV